MAKVVLTNVTTSDSVLKEVSIEIQDREFFVLVGPHGSGTWVLLRAVAGLENVSSGDIFIGEQRINDLPPSRRDVAMVFAGDSLYPGMTVFDNIALGLVLRKFARAKIKGRVTDAAQAVAIEDLLEKTPDSLSKTQRQRVAIARAIARQPKVLLLDHPLQEIDRSDQAQLGREISQLRDRLEATIIYATADSGEAMSMADRIAVLDRGTILQTDTPAVIYRQPANLSVARSLGQPAMNFVRGELRLVRGAVRFFEADNGTIEAPMAKSEEPKLQEWLNKPVVLGIRPESIELADSARWSGDSAISFVAIAEHVEPRGGETILYLDTGAHRVIGRSGQALERGESGRRMQLKMDQSRISLFDALSEKRIV